MTIQLKTQRLFLRPISIEDKESVFIYRSDPETSKYQSVVAETIDDMDDFLGKCAKEFNVPGTWFQVVIIMKDTDELIGDIGIHFLDDESKNRQVEIGYMLNKAFHGNGYATEAVKELINYLFDTMNKHRIIASVDPGNTPSIKLLERIGFRKEAHFKQSIWFKGEWVDDVVYCMLRRDWI